MKQIVTSKDDRYIEIKFHEWKKCVLVEETSMYFKMELLGAESPVTFSCELLDNTKADLKMYLSTDHREPNEKHCQRFVERMKRFKFSAKRKAKFFGDEDICYIMMESAIGCTLKITASSNRIKALAAPEKVKEFNVAMTKGQLAQAENEAKRKEVYIQDLEEKYDELLKDYLKKERHRKNAKKENMETVGFYKTKK